MAGTGDLIKRLAIRAVENGEFAAQVEIADAELRASLIRNIEATFAPTADDLEAAERVIERVNLMATTPAAEYVPALVDIVGETHDWLAAHATGQRQGGDDE